MSKSNVIPFLNEDEVIPDRFNELSNWACGTDISHTYLESEDQQDFFL